MDPAERLFELDLGPYCRDCTLREVCGAADTPDACRERWWDPADGGEHVLHPARSDTADHFAFVGGPGFGDVTVRPVLPPVLPDFLPQIRARRALNGYLPEHVYAVRAHEVLRRRRPVLTAQALRELVGLGPEQRLVLLLFDNDPILERIWREGPDLLPQIAQAGYDAITAPSFSVYRPRPRTEILFNLKRSLVVLDILQERGASVIPHVAWGIAHDIDRTAEWLNANPSVRLVALDRMTYRSDEDWRREMQGLIRLDESTGTRLRYLVNGPSTRDRAADLYRAAGTDRVAITNARAMARPPCRSEAQQLEFWPGDPAGARFEARVRAQRDILVRAAQQVAKGASTVAETIAPRGNAELLRAA